MASYATTEDLAAYHDLTIVSQLASDDGTPLSREDTINSPVVERMLSSASGEIEVNLLAGGRYTVAQLAALTGSQAEHLKRMTCAVAMSFLIQRRTSAVNSELAKTLINNAEAQLKNLAKGANVFGLPEAIDAGLPSVDGPTSLDYSRMRLLPDRMVRHFPTRSQRLPTDRG